MFHLKFVKENCERLVKALETCGGERRLHTYLVRVRFDSAREAFDFFLIFFSRDDEHAFLERESRGDAKIRRIYVCGITIGIVHLVVKTTDTIDVKYSFRSVPLTPVKQF
jgi:hypothetical protein